MAQISGFFEVLGTGLTLHLLTILHLYSIVASGTKLWGYGTRLSGLSEGGSLRGARSNKLHLSLLFSTLRPLRPVHCMSRRHYSPLRRRDVCVFPLPGPSLLARRQPRGSESKKKGPENMDMESSNSPAPCPQRRCLTCVVEADHSEARRQGYYIGHSTPDGGYTSNSGGGLHG